ncbi:MAG TPA: FGGY family carbohydrate kinase [Mycobacteriales bacterium]|nr:FGGY family carbohydrate kinase [Mycobacteriales bacterium]
MRSGPVLGVDIGTGSAKAVLFDPERGVLGRGAAAYPIRTPGPARAEQDPMDWWTATVIAVRMAVGDGADAVTALAVSGQGAALVLLDRAGTPVRAALIHLDQRAAGPAERLADSPVGAAVAAASGNRIGAWNIAAKLLWLRENEPLTGTAAAHLTSAAGFVLRCLAGRSVQSVSDAGISDLFDLSRRCWSAEVIDALDVPAGWLPDVAAATDVVGALTPAAAEALGLPESVLIVAGGEDASSAALAAGVLNADDGFVSLGTAGVAGAVAAAGTIREPRLLTFPHVREGHDIVSGSMTSAGSALSWCAALTGADVPTLLAEAATSPCGANGVLFVPYLAGELHPINDPDARGVFAGLSLSTTRADLGRAVLEGSAGAIAHNLVVAAGAGAAPHRLAVTGQPARSALWMQAIADATGMRVDVAADEGAALGDAVIAAAGSDDALPTLVSRHLSSSDSYHPRAAEYEAAVARRAAVAALYRASRQ